jgi:methyl-accepting chemotaxis protein
VNTAVTEMDKVTQQNAANAEESASAAEELFAQAEQMKKFVGTLTAMVGGSIRGNAGIVKQPRTQKRTVAAASRVPKTREISAGQVIPMGDDDLKESDFADF